MALYKFPIFFLFFSITVENLTETTNLQHTQSAVPSKTGQDTKSSSPHVEWNLHLFNHEKFKVQTSLARNDSKQALVLSSTHLPCVEKLMYHRHSCVFV